MEWIAAWEWEIFIAIEISLLIAFFAFALFRYGLGKRRVSFLFLGIFISLLIVEALLAWIVYSISKEISTFQIVVTVFVLYAFTFGIFDFIKLDRWLRQKIGAWRKVDLLTEKDYKIIERQKDTKYIARKYRISATIHLILFLIGQGALWYHGTGNFETMVYYLKDFSWFQSGMYEKSPYANETTYSIGVLWIIIFFIDFVWSWSYTLFPEKKKHP